MADVAILSQMCGSDGFAGADDHLVERAPLGELRVEFTAEFARPARTDLEATIDGWINVFHGRVLLGEDENSSARFMRQRHSSA